ncbi:MAG: acyl-CoA dehydrogenase family protein [Paraburkholderia sp.]|jgi:butyryl-CoA dehydrogenase
MSASTNEQHELIRETVRRFAEREIAPISKALWEEQGFAYEIWNRAGELGFLGLPYPEAHGGGGGDWVGVRIVLEEIARVDAAIESSIIAISTPASLLHNFGTEEQKVRFLRPILNGRRVGCIGLTEANAGSDVANIQTRAQWRDGNWIVNGSKTFITNSGTRISGPVVIAAVTGARSDGRKEISNFIVPADTPGFTLGRKLQKIGWRRSTTFELLFEDCVLAAAHLLEERGAGLRQTLSNISIGRILIGALGLGILQGLLECSVAYMKERSAFGKRLEQFQALRFKVTDIAMHAHAARLMLYDAVARKDCGLPCDVEASMAKLFVRQR